MPEKLENELVSVLEGGLEIWKLQIASIKEQDINAQVMDDRHMKILTSNIKDRGALESLPYIYKDGDTFQIISGHHRVRAANEAGMKTVYALVETNPLTKSQITSKQIAHNEIVGTTDSEVLAELIKQMDEVDDMIASGLPEEMLNSIKAESQTIDIPQLSFDWRVINFSFLPTQLRDFETLVKAMDSKTEMVGVADIEQYQAFCDALNKYGRTVNVTSISTVVSLLTEIALKEIEKCQQEDQADM